MKLPIRLENAITKLYKAFHSGTLNAFDCTACAVGNICDNTEGWAYYFGAHVKTTPSNIILSVHVPENLEGFSKNGYNQNELSMIENVFLKQWIGEKHNSHNKETQFKGLCAVVEYLCELDNIPNVMDYTKLFETENNEPKYQLEMK